MKKLFFLLPLLTLQLLSVAQDKYFVTFCADGGVPGHAFVSIGRESPTSMSSISDGTWGLYPANSAEGIGSPVIGEVPGGLRDDFLRNRDYTYTIEVSNTEYDKVKETVNKWRNKNYQLGQNDCLSFLIEVVNIFSGKIKAPSRSGLDNFPARYLKKLIDMN